MKPNPRDFACALRELIRPANQPEYESLFSLLLSFEQQLTRSGQPVSRLEEREAETRLYRQRIDLSRYVE
jgi:hypothetical protein